MSTLDRDTLEWLHGLGFRPKDHDLWIAALTHGSHDADVDYERLEFLRVLRNPGVESISDPGGLLVPQTIGPAPAAPEAAKDG